MKIFHTYFISYSMYHYIALASETNFGIVQGKNIFSGIFDEILWSVAFKSLLDPIQRSEKSLKNNCKEDQFSQITGTLPKVSFLTKIIQVSYLLTYPFWATCPQFPKVGFFIAVLSAFFHTGRSCTLFASMFHALKVFCHCCTPCFSRSYSDLETIYF